MTSNLTANGVCYDVAHSPYWCEFKGIRFYFSSAPHLDKFRNKVLIRIDWLNDSLSRRFHFNVKADWIAVFQLYCQVETRGFHVVDIASGNAWESKEELWLSTGLPYDLQGWHQQ